MRPAGRRRPTMQHRSAALLFLKLGLAASGLVALVQQQPGAAKGDPVQLIVLHLTGLGDESCKLAIATYDVSIADFANGAGHSYAFPGPASYLLPGATLLPFGGSYRDLIGGLANLPDLPLGRDPMARSVAALSVYDPAAVSNEAAVKRALATLTVSTSEVQRVAPVKEAVLRAWESGSEGRVARERLPYIEHWDTICYEILRANKSGGVWDGPFTDLLREEANIHGLDDALGVVGVITNPTMVNLIMAHARRA